MTADEVEEKPEPTSNYYNLRPRGLVVEKGVVVRVTNTYKGFYGLVREVNRYSKTWVWFINSTGTENKCKHKNVEVVAPNVEEYNKNRYFRKFVIPRLNKKVEARRRRTLILRRKNSKRIRKMHLQEK